MEIQFECLVSKQKERTYFTIPFEVSENVERMDIYYEYPRHIQYEKNGVRYDEEANIIDLGVIAADGEYIGASGSNRNHIFISAYESSQGYAAVPIVPGKWEIVVGAYKIAPQGVTVKYRVVFEMKRLRLFCGDTHIHTKGSDGALDSEEVVELCRKQHLDYAFITNHNNYSENDFLPRPADITVLPGTEWTHYKGHSGFLGVKRPYKNPFCVNSQQQAAAIIEEARFNGAMIVFNHPFDSPDCGWKWGFDIAPFDAVEVWNRAWMHENKNTRCLSWWHEQLCGGRKIPVIGGSDFHRIGLNSLPGIPCTCVYAMSRSPEDILSALRSGHTYIKMTPEMPNAEITETECLFGDTVCEGTAITVKFTRLRSGDKIRTITDKNQTETVTPENGREMQLCFQENGVKFVRYEILRKVDDCAPEVRILLTNPIYFEKRIPKGEKFTANADGKPRCCWANPKNERYVRYHDLEWGVPVHDDSKLFEMLILECFQAGLSWECVLNKREGFRAAFDGFDLQKVCAYDETKLESLGNDPSIIRNRLKIQAAVTNAQVFRAIQKECGSFSDYLWHWTNNRVVFENTKTSSPLSDEISKDLKKRGMKFVGTTVIYAYLQAVGIINSHEDGCFLAKEVKR